IIMALEEQEQQQQQGRDPHMTRPEDGKSLRPTSRSEFLGSLIEPSASIASNSSTSKRVDT
ncbi:hypothetical protein EV182_006431, partial [Spiromyces aspiralis]